MARFEAGLRLAAVWGFLLALLLLLLLDHGASAASFSYDETASNGPSKWAEEWPACGGSSQSPIDLTNAASDIPAGYFKIQNPLNPNAVVKWENNGHTLELIVSNQQTSAAGSTLTYVMNAVQFHFHTPSEHTVNGKYYDMELHLVTNSTVSGGTSPMAVVGLFFQIGNTPNALLSMLTPYVHEESANLTLPTVMTELISEFGSQFYEYSGSLTTPPCSEIVHWMVSTSVQTATAEQIAAFAEVMGKNNRPVQPTNGRILTNRLLTNFDLYTAIISEPLTIMADQYLALTLSADCATNTVTTILLTLQQLLGVPTQAMVATYYGCGSTVIYITAKGSSLVAARNLLTLLYAAALRAKTFGYVLSAAIVNEAMPPLTRSATTPTTGYTPIVEYVPYMTTTWGRISSSNPALFALLTLLVIPVAIFIGILIYCCLRGRHTTCPAACPMPCPTACPQMAATLLPSSPCAPAYPLTTVL